MQMLDPLGFWKTSREATLEAWSKLMINTVNSDEYARFTGNLLDQYLSATQPVQDMVQKSMTYSLAYLNMPTRDEVLSLAERLVHIETRLDDLDDETYERHGEAQKGIHGVERDLNKALDTLLARLDKLEAELAKKQETPAPKPIPALTPTPTPKAEHATPVTKPTPTPTPEAETKK
jgi:hypothetical protein